MTIEWTYDNPHGGSFDVDPDDFAGMSASAIEEELYDIALDNAKSDATCYILHLNSIVADIMGQLSKDEDSDNEDEEND